MNKIALRFKEFCGQAQYDKFMLKLAERGKLVFWQEQLWERFLRVADLKFGSDQDSITSFFRLEELRVPLQHQDQEPGGQTRDATFTRIFRLTYPCDERPVSRTPYRDHKSGVVLQDTLGPHRHFADFVVDLDWKGDSDEAVVQARSEPPLPIGCTETPPDVDIRRKFMQTVQATLQTNLAPDPRIARFLRYLRFRVRSFASGAIVSRGDEYSISCGYIPACHKLEIDQAGAAVAMLIKDLLAELSFGEPHANKKLEIALP